MVKLLLTFAKVGFIVVNYAQQPEGGKCMSLKSILHHWHYKQSHLFSQLNLTLDPQYPAYEENNSPENAWLLCLASQAFSPPNEYFNKKKSSKCNYMSIKSK